MLRKGGSNACRQGGLEDGCQKDRDRGDLRLCKIARLSELVIQIMEQEVMPQSGQKRYTSLTLFNLVHATTYPRS